MSVSVDLGRNRVKWIYPMTDLCVGYRWPWGRDKRSSGLVCLKLKE
jgi:hypothetical protein